MNNDDVLDYELTDDTDKLDVELINTKKFAVLCFTSFGLYTVWWMYKSWKFLKEKNGLDLMPVPRAIFSILFAYSLFERIQKYAHSQGYDKTYSSSGLFVAFIVINLLSRLPDPFWLLSFLSFVCLIQPFQALNYAISNSDVYNGVKRKGFNTRQLVLVIVGILLIGLIILGLMFPE